MVVIDKKAVRKDIVAVKS